MTIWTSVGSKMPNLSTYYLHFHSGLHLSASSVRLEESQVTLPSDTLFAALTHTWRYAGGDVEAWCSAFEQDPPAIIGSAFPFAGGIRFFPMPVRLEWLFGRQTLRERGTALKRLRFLSEGLLRRALDGQRLDDYLFPRDEYAEPEQGAALQEGDLWLSVDEVPALPDHMQPARGRLFALRRAAVWDRQSVPRVRVGRLTSASNLFHVGRTTFAPGCGLWFAVLWRDRGRPIGETTASAAFDQALAQLQDAGLGGERTAGYGSFRLAEPAELALPDPAPGGLAYLLNRYHPTEDDVEAGALAGDGVAYKLETVGGFLQSPDAPAQLRRRLRLIAPGSLVRLPGAVAGDLADVRPNYPGAAFPHPVLRHGYALGAGIAGETSSEPKEDGDE